MRKYLKIVFAAAVLVMFAIGAVLATNQFTLDSDSNGTAEFNVDTDGNTEIAGTLAVTGASTLTGNTAVTGTLAVTGAQTFTGAMTMNNAVTVSGDVAVTGNFDVKVYDLTVSSSTTSNDKVGFGGGFATFPTSGFSRGMVIFYSGGTEDVLGFYGSTATVTTASCWVRLS